MTSPRLLTIRQAAEQLGVGKTTVYDWIAKGRLKSVALPLKSSKTRIHEADLLAFIEAHKRSAA